jgi:hypothetical protein
MKTITFNYTKKDGSTSERTLLAITEPHPATDKYAGIDITELSPEDGAKFVSKYEQLYEEYLEATRELQAQYDVKHSYRQFFASGMSDVIEI